MKTRTLRKNKVNVVTLGCSKNIVDSEVLMGQLKANEIEVGHESAHADSNVVIINTCGFIENAKQESIDTILRYAAIRKRGEIDKLLVTGCLSERYAKELKKQYKSDSDVYKTGKQYYIAASSAFNGWIDAYKVSLEMGGASLPETDEAWINKAAAANKKFIEYVTDPNKPQPKALPVLSAVNVPHRARLAKIAGINIIHISREF